MQLIVGRILRPHGIRGEVIVEVRTDAPDERFAVGSVLGTDPTAVRSFGPATATAGTSRAGASSAGVSAASRPAGVEWVLPATLTVEQARPHQGRYIMLFAGVYDRDVAEALRGVLLVVDSEQVPSVDDPDEFNDFELVGLAAVDRGGQRIGEVIRIDHPPANDLVVLRRPDGRTALVPFVKAIVVEVDVPGGRMVVEPPEGLFDL